MPARTAALDLYHDSRHQSRVSQRGGSRRDTTPRPRPRGFNTYSHTDTPPHSALAKVGCKEFLFTLFRFNFYFGRGTTALISLYIIVISLPQFSYFFTAHVA